MDYRITQIAAPLSREAKSTQKAAKAALKAAGLPQARVSEVFAEIERIKGAREARRQRQARSGPRLRKGTGRAPVRLPAGPLAERLTRLRWNAVSEAHDRSRLRYGATGGSSFTVLFTDDPEQVGYTVQMGRNWNWGSYAAREDHHAVTVPYHWRQRVEKRNLAVVDSLLTLDASPLDGAPEGVELFAAVWVEQGRGYDVHVRRGVIARAGGLAFHGATTSSALAGLARKARYAKLSGDERETEKIAAFIRRHDRHRDAEICVSDAVAIGACEFGIRSWCNAVGIDYHAGCTTVGRVLDGYQKRPQPEVRRAVFHAVQRSKRAA